MAATVALQTVLIAVIGVVLLLPISLPFARSSST
jgi:hypothetical protein